MNIESNEVFELLRLLKRLAPTLLALENRELFPKKAVVYSNEDPENRRRIQVYEPSLDNLYPSEWIQPALTTRGYDPQVPKPGHTVTITYLDGDVNTPQYTIYLNDPNPVKDKKDPINDTWSDIEGNDDYHIGGDQKTSVKGDRNKKIEGNELIEILKDKTETIEGDDTLEVRGVRHIKISEKLIIECPNIQFKTSNMYINSSRKQITTVGARDSDNEKSGPDRIIKKGW